jgi:uncharacterized delta-60 repeat protein
MFRSVFVRLTAVAGLTGLASFGLLGGAPSTFAAGSAGSLDPTFGNGGAVVTSLQSNNAPTDAVLQPNGDIVVSVGIGAVRYLPDGSLDPTFGNGGIALAQPDFLGGGLTLQSDGKIVVVGNTELAGGGENFVVARFNPNGSLDSTFGTGGEVLSQPAGTIRTLGLDAAGDIFAPPPTASSAAAVSSTPASPGDDHGQLARRHRLRERRCVPVDGPVRAR